MASSRCHLCERGNWRSLHLKPGMEPAIDTGGESLCQAVRAHSKCEVPQFRTSFRLPEMAGRRFERGYRGRK